MILQIIILKIKTKETTSSTRSNLLFSGLSIGLLLISVSLYFNYSKDKSGHTNFTLTVFFIIILMLIVTIFFSITYFIDSLQKRKEYELVFNQNQLLEHSLKEQENTFSLWRKSIHDYKNTILAMEAMLKNGDEEKLASFLEEEHNAFMHRAEYIHTGNSTVDTVINTKYAIAKEKDIDFIVNAVMPKECTVSDIHLAAVLGNLIDNAIEASEKESEPYVDIEIAVKQNFLLIKIVNKCTSSNITKSTSKKNKEFHGIGLKSVRQIVNEYDGEFDLTFENDQATAQVMFRC